MTGITDLPAELLSFIGFLIAPADIINLRQTSRHILTSLDDAFAYYFFRHRSHLYTRHGMEVLHEISSRKYLRKKLKCVEIHIPFEDLYDLPTANALQKQDACVESLFPDQPLAIFEDNRSHIREAIRLNVFRLLESSLHNLAYAGIIPNLTFHRYDVMRFHERETPPFGTKALSRLHWLPPDRPSAHRSGVQLDVAAQIALGAIAGASFPARSLDLCGWPLDKRDFLTQEAVRSSAWSSEGPTHRALVLALGPNLRSLSITIKSEDLAKLSIKKPQGIAREHLSIGQIILSCPNLKKLRVGLCPMLHGPYYSVRDFGEHYGHFLFDWLANCRVETLELITGAFCWDDLKNVLESHKTSLQRLALLDVHLSSWMEWHNCASYLMDELALMHLHLRDNSTWERIAYYERRTYITTDSVDDKTLGDHENVGRDEIREMLLMVRNPWKLRGMSSIWS